MVNDGDPTIQMDRENEDGRARTIERAVRRALTVLSSTERTVIEGYYFDGSSFGNLANIVRQPQRRVRVIHRRALSRLEVELAPLVERMFGIRPARMINCPICQADWRDIAERLLDEKTPEMTWGDVMLRLERAVGWRAPTPQVLISHTKKHRVFTCEPKQTDPEDTDEPTNPSAWPSCD